MSNEKFSIGRSVATRSNVRCNIRSITCLQHQKKFLATSEQGYCNNRTKLLQYEMQDQKKETNTTKKYYLLQHHNKATATEQSAM